MPLKDSLLFALLKLLRYKMKIGVVQKKKKKKKKNLKKKHSEKL